MQHRFLVLSLAALFALALPACGDKGGGDGASSMAGTWVIDKTHAGEEMKKMMPEQMHASIPEMLEKIELTVEVKADGTWTSSGVNPMGKSSGSGTWSLDGENLTIVHKTKDGEPAKGMDDWKGTFKGDAVEIQDEVMGKPVTRRMIRK